MKNFLKAAFVLAVLVVFSKAQNGARTTNRLFCMHDNSRTASPIKLKFARRLNWFWAEMLNQRYYWRDYINDLPDDAVPGGTDQNGQRIYIGQTVHVGYSGIPGTLRPEQRKIFYELSGTEHSSNEDLKILCSLNPNRFRWIDTKNGQSVAALTTTGKQLIRAGTDKGRVLYVGRVVYTEEEMLIGKLLIIRDKFGDVWVSRNGTGWSQTEYEVLVYDATIPAKSESSCAMKQIVVNVYN